VTGNQETMSKMASRSDWPLPFTGTPKALQSFFVWDEQDYFSRWVQGICALILGFGAVGGIYMMTHSTITMFRLGGVAATIGCIRVSWRCACYAITGRNSINRDEF
jgi:hypothetical protein